ncbi:hypothetical protein SAMN05216188_121105 [Lentzea xinjiangensis]|uniref:Uncharacterized protein n=1 Tax=Lentzea xinjiangensis TaxID=402600 RepID=A0A1H9UGA9_9PSEU|nr:hypothetical protein [Lentzea xinjiangensis]SES08570.1 hypothetical protein SAMN05216188_121105 [Lentzea xinjiangensis]
MATKPCPSRGAIVTYLNPDVMHPSVYVRGVVIGTHVVDPQTAHTWVPVIRSDGTMLVLDTANIIKVAASS